VALLFVVFGFLFATYFATVKLPQIFAASSWTQTDWSGGTASDTVTGTATTYESLSSTDASTTAGQVILTNTEKFSNTGFETNLNGWTGFSATGGTITTSEGYTIHTFTTSGTFTPNGAGNVEVLVVGGGGGGGNNYSARGVSGGAGGLIYIGNFPVSNETYTITIGLGGGEGISGNNSVVSCNWCYTQLTQVCNFKFGIS